MPEPFISPRMFPRRPPVVLLATPACEPLEAMQEGLEESGYHVELIHDGGSVPQRAAQLQPDAILMATEWPDASGLVSGVSSGLDWVRCIRHASSTSHLPVLLLLNDGSERSVASAYGAGATDHLLMPARMSELLARLQVHSRAAQAAREQAHVSRQALSALDAFGYASLTIRLQDSSLLWQTPLAQELLWRYFGTRPPVVPEPVLRWMKKSLQGGATTTLPMGEPPRLHVDRGDTRLSLRLHGGLHAEGERPEPETERREGWLVVMAEQSISVTQQSLSKHFGLTAREAEVLYWVTQGKTNRDIGDILGSSPATVKKHTERLYAKLGVETRTAAAAMALGRSGCGHAGAHLH